MLGKYNGFAGGDVLPAENVNSINPSSIIPIGKLVGGSNVSTLATLVALGAGANNGKFSINVDGVQYSNLSLDLSGDIITQNSSSTYYEMTSTAYWKYQSFTVGATVGYLGSVDLYLEKVGTPAGNLYVKIFAVSGDTPTGSPLATATVAHSTISSAGFYNVPIGLQLSTSTKYAIVIHGENYTASNKMRWYFNSGSVYSGGIAQNSTNSGSSYSDVSGDYRFKVNFTVSYALIASRLQTVIRTATSGKESVAYDTNKFVITSGTLLTSSKILKLISPSSGTDISGNASDGATKYYLDCGTNATEYIANITADWLVRIGTNGLVPQSLLPIKNYSVADQAISATTRTYITGSMLQIAGTLSVGSMLRWRFNMAKTGAGSASSTIDVCFGTNGDTNDTARLSFTKPAGTAVVDEAVVEIFATIRSIGASGVAVGEFKMVHNLQTTGHATIPCVVVNNISSGFDMTIPNLKVGVCITTGASDAITINMVQAEVIQL